MTMEVSNVSVRAAGSGYVTPVCGLVNTDRVAQLIKRDAAGNDLIVLDILGSNSEGAQGIHLGEDLAGLYFMPTSQPLKSFAYQEGATPSVYPRKKERRPKLTLITEGDTPAEWEQIETLLWSVLSVKWDCFLRLYAADGTWRELQIRLFDDVPDKTQLMYGKRRFHVWTDLPLLAWDPFWRSAPITFEFTRAQMTYTSSTNTYSMQVPVSNPCDNRAYVEWASGTVQGTEVWTLPDADSGAMVTLPSLTAGHEFLVMTYPTDPTMLTRFGGNGDWARMRGVTFNDWLTESTPNARYVTVKLQGGTADSRLKMWIPQRWDRPFGGQVIA